MKTQIIRVSPIQTAKVMAIIYFVITLPFAVLFAMMGSFGPAHSFGIGFAIAIPFLYMIFGFIFCAIGAWVYNVVASQVGGIEFSLQDITTE